MNDITYQSTKVAEKLFGWAWQEQASGKKLFVPPVDSKEAGWAAQWDKDGVPNYLPDYTRSMSRCWEIVERLRDLGFNITLTWQGKSCDATIISRETGVIVGQGHSVNMPKAVVRAVLGME